MMNNANAFSGMMKRVPLIYWVAVIVTLLFIWRQSAISFAFNKDAASYLQTAGQFLLQGTEAFHHLSAQGTWPFYSILIALFSRVAHLSLLDSAHWLNAFFQVATVLVFLKLIQAFGGNRKAQWWGLLVILTWHVFTSYWCDILRDHGFNLCFLLSIWFFCQYKREQSWRMVMAWLFFTITMLLFRREGIVYLVLVPVSVLCFQESWIDRLRIFIKLISPGLVVILSGIVFLHFSEMNMHFVTSKFNYLLVQVKHNIAINFNRGIVDIGEVVVKQHASHEGWGFLGMLIGMLVANAFSVFGWVTIIAILYCVVCRKPFLPIQNKKIIVAYALISLLVPLVFILQTSFVSKRYLMALGLVITLCVPFVLEVVFSDRKHWRWLWQFLFVLAVTYSAVASLFAFGPNYALLEKHAGVWLKNNINEEATIAGNAKIALFYADRSNGYQSGLSWVEQRKIVNHCYDYLVLLTKQADQLNPYLDDIDVHYKILKQFSAPNHKRTVQVYGLKVPGKCKIY